MFGVWSVCLVFVPALSEYQLTISLAVPQSGKFCSVGLPCHHFSAAPFQLTDPCRISTCTLRQPFFCLSPPPLSLCHFLSLSHSLSLSFPPSLSLWTGSQHSAATGSDRRIFGCICNYKCTAEACFCMWERV